MIELNGISHTYTAESGAPVPALSEISLEVPNSQIICLLGPSGCGKSTLLKLIAGFEQPTEGEIWVTDTERTQVTEPGIDRGVVFQQPNLFPWLSVADNVALASRYTGSSEVREEASTLLELVGLTDFANSYPHELSGGMQQRAQIARVLAARPRYVLMDEPFGALDPFTREQLQAQLLGIWQHYTPTIVFVTHSVEEALLIGHRVVVLSARPGSVRRDLTVPERLRVSDAATSQDERLAHMWQVVADPEFVGLRAQLNEAVHDAHVAAP